MLTRIRHILEMIRFSHTLFALPFALLATLLACRLLGAEAAIKREAIATYATPVHIILPDELKLADLRPLLHEFPAACRPEFIWPWMRILGVILCMVAGRSAAMAFNRLADRKIDALNPRTAQRHLPSGVLSVGSVAAFAAVSSAAFIASTLLFLPNRLPLYLAVPMLLFLLGYSYTKRFTMLAHFWLGGALGLAPIMAWIAIRGENVMANFWDLLPVIVLGGAVKMWVAGFDIIYACQDVEFDRAQNLHSIPARWGVKRALDMAATCHLLMVVLLLALPLVYPLIGWLWWVGVAAIAVLLVYEHRLVTPDDLARVNMAFFNVNAVVSVGLLIVGAAAMWV
ncbi:MAG TPA: UbiA-like polyprenyltransferase [Pirellulales bacterium]|nr:UbiA-like polyprenyltransferase [Pirellulales bacterium]